MLKGVKIKLNYYIVLVKLLLHFKLNYYVFILNC